MSNNKLTLKCIDELIKEEFYIPDYQRGYRWTEVQVNALLNDIWKFRAESQEAKREVFYCLQPIVVARESERWILIDGQQRLTTIHIILTYLSNFLQHRERKNFGLSYQTRPDSETFLNQPILERAKENVDYFHISEAFKTIDKWFKSKSNNAPLNFIQTLLNSDEEGKNVKVIWYEVDENETPNHIDIFTRLNIGKIPLTNAELIKALLLQKRNFVLERANLKQIQIASEWDYIERSLQQDEFWYFIKNASVKTQYDNHIEYIFDLMYDRSKDHEEHYTFFQFLKAFDSIGEEQSNYKNIDNLWLDVKSYFLTFEEWYQNRELYHLIGFLVACNFEVTKLKKASVDISKVEFKNYLLEQIKKQVDYDICELEYGSRIDNDKIRKVLLLFNIQTLLVNKGADVRFPFHRYKLGKWDIEHIRSQTEKKIKGKKQKQEWIDDVLDYFTSKKMQQFSEIVNKDEYFDENEISEEVKTICVNLINLYQEEDISDEIFEQEKKIVEGYLKEDTEKVVEGSEIKDGIGNLSLLDEETNRSYKNALFPIKRKKIIENDKVGKFVPICTKNVFLKYYSKQFEEVMYWKVSDAMDYIKSIKEILKGILPDTH